MNSYRHFFLYAKNWYKQTDLESDLRILCNDWNGCSNATLWDMQNITLNGIKEIMPKRHIDIEKFCTYLEEQSRISFFGTDRYPLVISLIRTNLYIMRFTEKDLLGDLGEPNYNLLPESEDSITIRSRGE